MSVPIQKLVDAALRRAAYDRAFRAMLLAAPGEAIRAAFGVEAPAGAGLRFTEQGPVEPPTYVLPPLADDEELSDEELDAAAGGSDDWFDETGGSGGGGG